MRRSLKIIFPLLVIALLIALYYFSQDHEACPAEGTARQFRMQELNRLKNRSNLPGESDFDHSVTIEQVLSPGDDYQRWSNDKAAELEAYVYEVKDGGKETCNCESEDEPDKDTHIELITDPMHYSHSNKVIVEVTPRLRKKMAARGIDWSTRTLRDKILGRWVKIKGWMVFDFEHERQADNTNPGGKRNWRATAWEIHPITSIEIIPKPQNPEASEK